MSRSAGRAAPDLDLAVAVMAINISVTELVATRSGSARTDRGGRRRPTRLLAVASAAVERFMGDAFADAYPTLLRGRGRHPPGAAFAFDHAKRRPRHRLFGCDAVDSGALQILAGWRIHRAGSTAEGSADAAAATGTNGNNPVVGVSVVGDDLLIVTKLQMAPSPRPRRYRQTTTTTKRRGLQPRLHRQPQTRRA